MELKTYLKLQTILLSKTDGLTVEYLHGYMTAVICAPDPIKPSVWLTILNNNDGNVADSIEESQMIIELVFQVYNEIAISLMEKTFEPLYSICENDAIPGNAQIWCQGFNAGLCLWNEVLPDDENIKSLIMPILILAEEQLFCEVVAKDLGKEITETELNEMKSKLFAKIRNNVIALRHLNVSTAKLLSIKPSRNESCPCGSGKKFKQCCEVE